MTTMTLNVMLDHKLEEHDLERFWNLELMGISQHDTPKNVVNFQESYKKSGITLKDQKYCTKMPWTDDCQDILTNKNIILKQTENFINKLSKDPNMPKMYEEILSD